MVTTGSQTSSSRTLGSHNERTSRPECGLTRACSRRPEVVPELRSGTSSLEDEAVYKFVRLRK